MRRAGAWCPKSLRCRRPASPGQDTNTQNDGQLFFGVLFFSVLFMLLGAIGEMHLLVDRIAVVFKQVRWGCRCCWQAASPSWREGGRLPRVLRV